MGGHAPQRALEIAIGRQPTQLQAQPDHCLRHLGADAHQQHPGPQQACRLHHRQKTLSDLVGDQPGLIPGRALWAWFAGDGRLRLALAATKSCCAARS
jgi:hypothetical protein